MESEAKKKLTPDVMRRIAEVAADVIVERARQHGKWGAQDCPNLFLEAQYSLHASDVQRVTCQERFRQGIGSWADILLEELAEGLDEARRAAMAPAGSADREGALNDLRDELVQVAAVAAAWVEAVDREIRREWSVRNDRLELEE